jgi:predicted amidohydrolase YtcJ
MRRFAILILWVGAFWCSRTDATHPAVQMPGPITLAVVNARVWTGDRAAPWAEALAASGERLVAVGTNSDVRQVASAVTPIDAGGRLVLPGFIDTHVHFLEGGLRLASVQLRDARTRDEFVSRIKAFAAKMPEGTWITGGDWDHTLWGGELPSKDWIDGVTPNHPVWINRLDGHMNLANSAALKAAGVTRSTADVPGGEIARRADGEPTGLLKDNGARGEGCTPAIAGDAAAGGRGRHALRRRARRDHGSRHEHLGGMGRYDPLRRAAPDACVADTRLQRRAARAVGAPARRRCPP